MPGVGRGSLGSGRALPPLDHNYTRSNPLRTRALTVFILLLLFVAFFPEQAGMAAERLVAAILNALLGLLQDAGTGGGAGG